MRPRGRRRTWAALGVLLSVGGIGGAAEEQEGRRRAGWGVLGARAQSTDAQVGRWAQAGALLSPQDDPTFLVVSGKTTVAGQTVTSTPSTSSALSLSLSSPIADLSSPPWTDLSSTGPISAYGSLVPLSASSAAYFGGDATGDSTIAVQTGNDSSWLLSLASSSSSSDFTSTWTYESSALWPSQPQRRELAYTASATNGILSRAWFFGGQRPDGSGVTFSELWELQLAVSPDDGSVDASSASWAMWSGEGGPPAMHDGTAVLVPSSTSGALPSIYLVGGAQVEAGTAALAPLDSLWVFTPSDAIGGGSWAEVEMGGTVPTARRGHVAVDVGDGKIWIQGGRSLDGATVFSDAAVLDTKAKSWTATSAGEQGWGRSAVMVGETVVLAFGYGVNSPLTTALAIYAPANDTWLSAYYPSFVSSAVVSNPKAGSGSSASAGSSPAASPGTQPSDPTATMPAASPSASSGSNGHDTGDSPTSPQWTAPGAAGSTTPSASNPCGDNNKDSSDAGGSGASKSTIAGAVVGGVFGALVLAAGAGFAYKRHRDNQRYGARFTGDDELDGGGPGGGAGGLMAEHRSTAGFASSEMYNLGKALPVTPGGTIRGAAGAGGAKGGAGAGVMSALVGLLSPRERFASTGPKRRFDMLKDEEEADVWDADLHREEKRGWQQFADHDEAADDFSTPSLKGRGGMGIWDGFGSTGGTIKSSTSYLGGALGGFIGLVGGSAAAGSRGAADERDEEKAAAMAAGQEHVYAEIAPQQGRYADPLLTPIVEWEEDEDEDDPAHADDSRTLESHNTHSSATHQTASTMPTSTEASPVKHPQLSRSVRAGSSSRPFSPAPSLPGSSFNPQPATFAALGQSLSRTSSAASSSIAHHQQQHQRTASFLPRSNSSWWSRLNKSSAADVPTPTAFEAIRDPAPAPNLSLAAIAERDPFADASSLSRQLSSSSDLGRRPSTHVSRPRSGTVELDEHGRFADGVRLTHGEHDRSVSSNTSDVTATSSVLEERLRNMDVVQRVRTGSERTGGDSSCEVTPTLGVSEDGGFGRLPSHSEDVEDPFADAPEPAGRSTSRTPAAESVVWAGSQVGLASPRTRTPPPVPPLPVIQPPTPTYAPPTSPRKLLGPRPLPPPSPPSASSSSSPFSAPSRSIALPARSNSVKDLVARIERSGSTSSNLAGRGGGDENRSMSLSAPSTPRKKHGHGKGKVEHGFARKPVLYVANPDA
ncbi:hypothetical protein JCM8097_005613 [Rhodosporidiobolus ruineniae]